MFGHPRGLSILFLTEMWERFSFYGMRALLTLYLVSVILTPGHESSVLGLGAMRSGFSQFYGPLNDQDFAARLYAGYTAMVYLTPLLGGWVADRFLGRTASVTTGGLIMALGHFLMASEMLLLPALALIAFGVGFFKPNLTSQIGTLYANDDPRRDRGFNVAYLGINLGAFLAPLICGTLGEMVGWHYGFGAAGIGMMIGLATYLHGRRYLPATDSRADRPFAAISRARTDRRLLMACILLIALTTTFWITHELQGFALVLWLRDGLDRNIGGFEVPITWILSLNFLFVVILTFAVGALWRRLGAHGREPGSIGKMAIGAAICALAHVFIAGVASFTDNVPLIAVAIFVMIWTFAELCLSPTTQAAISRLAPPRYAVLLMGASYLGMFAGNLASGSLNVMWDDVSPARFWSIAAIFPAIGAVGLLLLGGFVDRLQTQISRI